MVYFLSESVSIMYPSFYFLESCVFFFEAPTSLGQNPHFHFLLLLRGSKGCKNKEKNISFFLKIVVHMDVVDSNSGGTKVESLTSDLVPQESSRLSLSGELYSRGYSILPGLVAVIGGGVLLLIIVVIFGGISPTQ